MRGGGGKNDLERRTSQLRALGFDPTSTLQAIKHLVDEFAVTPAEFTQLLRDLERELKDIEVHFENRLSHLTKDIENLNTKVESKIETAVLRVKLWAIAGTVSAVLAGIALLFTYWRIFPSAPPVP